MAGMQDDRLTKSSTATTDGSRERGHPPDVTATNGKVHVDFVLVREGWDVFADVGEVDPKIFDGTCHTCWD
jgi:hypothetical protein